MVLKNISLELINNYILQYSENLTKIRLDLRLIYPVQFLSCFAVHSNLFMFHLKLATFLRIVRLIKSLEKLRANRTNDFKKFSLSTTNP